MQYFIYCSLFGKAFEQAAKNTGSYINADYFDTTSKIYLINIYALLLHNVLYHFDFVFAVVRLKVEERPKFFDALAALLT